ncbi:MAG: transcription-repair coupling factor, partial [Treponema sp.]|nr:transcription-repair coupling factor [Treponema sp.]
MKSLTSINEILHNWQDFKSAAASIVSQDMSYPCNIQGVQGSLFTFFADEIFKAAHYQSLQSSQYGASSKKTPEYKSFSSDFLIVVPTENEALDIYNDFKTVFDKEDVFIFPSWGTVPYRPSPRGSLTFGKRAGVLSQLVNSNESISFKEHSRIFIFTQRSFMSPLPSPDYIKGLSFKLKKGDQLNTTKIADNLTNLGYTRVPKVNVRGEFSLRGEVLDIFPPNDEHAVRIIFDFDQIEHIKDFDADSQTTIGSKESILISPMKEIIWTPEFITRAEEELKAYQESAITILQDTSDNKDVHLPFTETALKMQDKILAELKHTGQAEGEEFFYNLLWDQQYTVLDYLNPNAFVLFYNFDKLENGQLVIEREYEKLYRTSREQYPVLPVAKTLLNFEKTRENISRCLLFRTLQKSEDLNSSSIVISAEPPRSFFGNINFIKEEFTNLQADNWSIFIYTDNENQQLRIHEIFKDFIADENDNGPLILIPKPISAGFCIPELKLLVIQENEIFGRRKYVPKTVNKAKSRVIDTFVELNPGDYVVHVNWGIGLFHGIERVKSLGNERDYIKLEYADNEFAFVPIEQVNLVQRYIGNEGEKPRLDRIGSKSWENRKSKVKQAVEDIAQKLIDLYSRRQAAVGYAFPKETEWQAAFEAAFPYEDTPDQITVTEEIKADMEKPVPMDRLVCGDVGYGKTEIAMRAAFKAVMGGKQVAFLAPTTILAEQHFETCKERFKNFPVRIERLSRFVAPAEQKKILERAGKGEVDILVGTHRIIQKDVKFKNLGLMIIDEEQRFGVKDKEKLKVMKNNIDCLTMSATPIPRTLHMSLLKIRDMSLLTTPPQNRQPIETVVDEYTDERIAQAIRREIERGGQVFYLHNRVESLMEVQHRIESIVPEVLIDVAHGQMTSSQLEEIFQRFKMGGFHVLIATTIIENG